MNLPIEKNIPAPAGARFKWRKPLDRLKFGESFAFDNALRSNVANAVSGYFHKLTDKRFRISADPKNPDTKSRVWRLEDAKL